MASSCRCCSVAVFAVVPFDLAVVSRAPATNAPEPRLWSLSYTLPYLSDRVMELCQGPHALLYNTVFLAVGVHEERPPAASGSLLHPLPSSERRKDPICPTKGDEAGCWQSFSTVNKQCQTVKQNSDSPDYCTYSHVIVDGLMATCSAHTHYFGDPQRSVLLVAAKTTLLKCARRHTSQRSEA